MEMSTLEIFAKIWVGGSVNQEIKKIPERKIIFQKESVDSGYFHGVFMLWSTVSKWMSAKKILYISCFPLFHDRTTFFYTFNHYNVGCRAVSYVQQTICN